MANDKIKVASDHLHVKSNGGLQNIIRKAAFAQGHVPNWDKQGTVQAVINHGRWIVECPHCPDALDTEPGALFFCPSCGNGVNGGKSYVVIFPENRNAIEAALLKRSAVESRNWKPGETVEQLTQENEQRGID